MSLLLLAVLLLLGVTPIPAQPGCRTQTQFNPIEQDYPSSISGVANGTFSLLPIPRSVAKSLLPAGTDFIDVQPWGDDYIPLLIRAVYVHNIVGPNKTWKNDHTVISLELPFVDALHDGKTPFRYAYTQFIQVLIPSYAIDVAKQYGVPHIIPSVFQPECDAYQFAQDLTPAITWPGYPRALPVLKGIPADGSGRSITILTPMQVTREARPFDTDELKRIINQPRFGVGKDGPVCGRTRVFFEEEVGFAARVETKGEVSLSGSFESLDVLLEGDGAGWNPVYGIQVATAFVDDDFVNCKGLAD